LRKFNGRSIRQIVQNGQFSPVLEGSRRIAASVALTLPEQVGQPRDVDGDHPRRVRDDPEADVG
jgi:hypothetical protein